MLDLAKIKAITIDLDDTLWPIWPVIERAEKGAARVAGRQRAHDRGAVLEPGGAARDPRGDRPTSGPT
jgi:FMN phosphatase YigB (HAD superfamily)